MAGLTAQTPNPTSITVHEQSRVLEIGFADGASFRIPFELMRVYSPSAEVQGHGPGQEVLQTGKRHVSIKDVEAVGHYAIRPTFSDGHDSGIYSWDWLYHLAVNHESLWAEYLERLEKAGASRDIDSTTLPPKVAPSAMIRLLSSAPKCSVWPAAKLPSMVSGAAPVTLIVSKPCAPSLNVVAAVRFKVSASMPSPATAPGRERSGLGCRSGVVVM